MQPARPRLGSAGVQRDPLGGRASVNRRRPGARGPQAQGRPAQRRPPGTGPARAGRAAPQAHSGIWHDTGWAVVRTYRGATYLPSTLWQVLQKARKQALTPAQVASPLARRPYDFRHAGVSWRLNAGTPAPLVAEWAGHTGEVLLRIYAHCIDGDDERWFRPMEDALGRG